MDDAWYGENQTVLASHKLAGQVKSQVNDCQVEVKSRVISLKSSPNNGSTNGHGFHGLSGVLLEDILADAVPPQN